VVVYQSKKKINNLFQIKYNIIFRMRLGRSGGHWRHIVQTNNHAGSNLLFVDGF
jgi:hypothetical protein